MIFLRYLMQRLNQRSVIAVDLVFNAMAMDDKNGLFAQIPRAQHVGVDLPVGLVHGGLVHSHRPWNNQKRKGMRKGRKDGLQS